jgi:hypothetical protein
MTKHITEPDNLEDYKLYWKANRQKFIGELREIYRGNNLTLVLGSGVSRAAGLPLWPDLVKRLYADVITQNFKLFEPDWESLDLKMDELILQARYIKNGYESHDLFYKSIINALYCQEVHLKAPLLNGIGKLCMPTRHNFLKSVITYNFDDVLERKLHKMHVEFKTISDSNVNVKKTALPIYHVHGFLPESLDEFDNLNIIFSDDDYNRQSSSQLYSWSNIIQLTHFKESTCFFLGTSFNDANLRRILEIVKHNFQGVKNYTILKHSFEPEKHSECLKNHFYINDILKERVLNDIGINIIWVDDFEEIPSIVSKIS